MSESIFKLTPTENLNAIHFKLIITSNSLLYLHMDAAVLLDTNNLEMSLLTKNQYTSMNITCMHG